MGHAYTTVFLYSKCHFVIESFHCIYYSLFKSIIYLKYLSACNMTVLNLHLCDVLEKVVQDQIQRDGLIVGCIGEVGLEKVLKPSQNHS